MSTIEVNKITPVSGGTTVQVGESGDTINIPSGATLANAGSVTGLPASAISSGTIASARLGSGTASSSTVLYGDGTFKAEPGGAFTRVGGSSSTSQTANIDFDNVFTSTYTQYLITIACQFVSNNSHLLLRMRSGGSVDTGTEYSWIVGGRGVSGTSESGIGNGEGNSSDSSYKVNQWGASDNNTENIFYQIHVRNPLPSTTSNAEGNYVMFQNTCTLWTSDNYMTIQHGGGRKSGGTDNDGIRFYLTAGDFRTFDVDIYGLQGS